MKEEWEDSKTAVPGNTLISAVYAMIPDHEHLYTRIVTEGSSVPLLIRIDVEVKHPDPELRGNIFIIRHQQGSAEIVNVSGHSGTGIAEKFNRTTGIAYKTFEDSSGGLDTALM